MQVIGKADTLYYSWPVLDGGTDIPDGALLMPGVTAETNVGVLIVATGAAADAVGVLQGLRDASETTDTNVAGTAWNTDLVSPIISGVVVRAEYDQADDMDVASTSTVTTTITSLEDNIDTGYLYAVSGTGAGLLAFIITSASGSCTHVTATAWDSTTDVIKILPLFHQLAKLRTEADRIGTDAAAGSWTIAVLQNWIKNNTRSWEALNPLTHDNLSGLSATGLATKFYCDLVVRNSIAYTTE